MASTLGNRIRELRNLNKLNQEELAKKLDVTRSTIAAYEIGINEPKMDKLRKLAKIFDVSYDYLLGKSNYKNIESAQEHWKKLDKNRYKTNDLKLLVENLIEQVIRDDDLTVNNAILTDNQKNIILSQLENIIEILSLF